MLDTIAVLLRRESGCRPLAGIDTQPRTLDVLVIDDRLAVAGRTRALLSRTSVRADQSPIPRPQCRFSCHATSTVSARIASISLNRSSASLTICTSFRLIGPQCLRMKRSPTAVLSTANCGHRPRVGGCKANHDNDLELASIGRGFAPRPAILGP